MGSVAQDAKDHSLIPEDPDEDAAVPIRDWRQERPFDSAEYLEGPPPSYADSRVESLGDVKLIPTKRLRSTDIPRIDPQHIDYSKPTTPQLNGLWAFALTFDGYRYFGVTDAPGRLGEFARSVEEEFRQTGALPRLGEIGMFRACLFFEQRNWCKWGKVFSEPTVDDVRYLSAVLEAVRSRVT